MVESMAATIVCGASASRTPASIPGRYDLLASEARLTSFVAIAKGDVPVSHWFRLGRALTPVEQDSALVSWSGRCSSI